MSKIFLPAFAILLVPAFACSGGADFTTSASHDAGGGADASDTPNVVANPVDNSNEDEAGSVDATAGPPGIDASLTDAGVNPGDAAPDALGCSSSGLACEGGCVANDLHNCGACGTACAQPMNGTATCAASGNTYSCGVSCSANFTHCGGSCVDLQSDQKNCGSCGHDCLSGTCSTGKCQAWSITQTGQSVLITDSPGGARGKIVTDGKNVAWLDIQAGILEVPIVGGSQVVLAPMTVSNTINLQSIALAGGVVAWTTTDTTNGVSVWTAAEGVANSGTIAIALGAATAGETPRGLALDSTGRFAYFVEDPAGSGAMALVYKCDLVGKSCTQLQTTPASKDSTIPNDIAIVGSTLFWTDSANGNILRADYSHNLIGPIAAGQDAPYLLAADAQYIYWASARKNNGGADTFSVSRTSQASPTTVETVLPDIDGDLMSMAVDGVNLYFAALALGTEVLDYAPLTGASQPQSLYSALPFAVAAAGGTVYWLNAEADNAFEIYGLRFP